MRAVRVDYYFSDMIFSRMFVLLAGTLVFEQEVGKYVPSSCRVKESATAAMKENKTCKMSFLCQKVNADRSAFLNTFLTSYNPPLDTLNDFSPPFGVLGFCLVI